MPVTSFYAVLAPSLASEPVLSRALERLRGGEDVTLAAPGLVRPLLTAAAAAEWNGPVLVVVPGEDAAVRFARQIATYIGHDRVLRLPERCDMPWDRTAPDFESVGARARALYSLDKGRRVVVVASGRSLLRALPPQGSHVYEPIRLAAGAMIDLGETVDRLVRMGYERVDTAEERGQFAVRGGTLDVFGSDASHPVRAELFGDEIESLRRYIPSTQQHIGDSEAVEVFPCREVLPGTRAGGNVRRAFGEAVRLDEQLAHDLELIEQGQTFNGIEQYLPYLYKSTGSVLDHVSPGALVVVAEPRAVFDDLVRARDDVRPARARWAVRSTVCSSSRRRSIWAVVSGSPSCRSSARAPPPTARWSCAGRRWGGMKNRSPPACARCSTRGTAWSPACVTGRAASGCRPRS